MKTLFFAGFVASFLAVSAAPAAAAVAYLQMRDVPGDGSNVDGYPQTIELLSFDQDITVALRTGAKGGTKDFASPTFGAIHLSMYMSASWPRLVDRAVQPNDDDEATLVLMQRVDKAVSPLLTIKLKGVRVTAIDYSLSDGDSRGTVDVTLTYNKISWDYDAQNADGKTKTRVSTSWDLLRGARN